MIYLAISFVAVFLIVFVSIYLFALVTGIPSRPKFPIVRSAGLRGAGEVAKKKLGVTVSDSHKK
jgi:hypothetical protein